MVAVVLLLIGVAVRPLESGRTVAGSEISGLRSGHLQGALGQGVAAGLLGGFRAIMADLCWLRANASWEDCDLPATQTLIKLVTALDPRPLYFWLNGARIIAYDMPGWRMAGGGGCTQMPLAAQEAIEREQAGIALQYLEEALASHPSSATVWIEMANIHLNRLKDLRTAAECYRRAAGQPHAPYFAARIYAELLRRQGRDREAYTWLVRLHPTLPPMNDEAMAPVVLERIRELERRLAIPDELRYRKISYNL
jgi:tetratricopeptide (TPR) repeat protein